MDAISTYQQAEDYLYKFINLEIRQTPYTKRAYRLDRMEAFLAFAGNPHYGAQCVHIAGSKGKGSTALFIAALIKEKGYRVGLYTSPHIIHLRERIQIDQKPISKELFIRLVRQVETILSRHPAGDFPGEIQPTFFEIITLIGFLAFKESGCDYWVLETGLGGRLDATNVIIPLVSVLTPIEFEHEDILGDTIEKIAAEKCGIIKEAVPVFSSKQLPAAKRIIEESSEKQKTSAVFFDDAIQKLSCVIAAHGTKIACLFKNDITVQTKIRMLGQHQAENAMLACLVFGQLFGVIDNALVDRAFFSARLPGRLEILREEPMLLIDGAHTPESIKRSIRVIKAISQKPRVLLFACINGKKYKEMTRILADEFSKIIVSTPGTFKKSNPAEVYQFVKKKHEDVEFVDDPKAALSAALQTGLPVFALGSFYFAAEIRSVFLNNSRDL
ncbi:MAG: bifunctional folylpolyglutamate synthase/dihydrofolate synthase [Spirochaetales bacterium]|nr:bifunctional folylpolyglutamate synthase/dihydrofolate synthase [Spirochaetales bacterium]